MWTDRSAPIYIYLFVCRSCQNAYCTDLSFDLYICLSTSVGRSVCPVCLSICPSFCVDYPATSVMYSPSIYIYIYMWSIFVYIVPSIRAWWALFHILKQCRIWIRLVRQVVRFLSTCCRVSAPQPCCHWSTAAVGDGEVRKTWSTMRFHRTAPVDATATTAVLTRVPRFCTVRTS